MKEKQIEEMATIALKNTMTYTCAKQIAMNFYNAGYRKQEWISVDERLPEECKAVLCFAGDEIVLAFMEKNEDCGEYVPVFWDLVAYNRDDTWDEVCATHWMPLPEAPKMKGADDERKAD